MTILFSLVDLSHLLIFSKRKGVALKFVCTNLYIMLGTRSPYCFNFNSLIYLCKTIWLTYILPVY